MDHPAALHRLKVGVPATVEHASESGDAQQTSQWVAETTQVPSITIIFVSRHPFRGSSHLAFCSHSSTSWMQSNSGCVQRISYIRCFRSLSRATRDLKAVKTSKAEARWSLGRYPFTATSDNHGFRPLLILSRLQVDTTQWNESIG